MDMENVVKGLIAAVMSVVTYLFGGFDGLITAFFVLVTLDYITGFLAAAHEGKLNSQIGAKGIIKKVMYMAVVALAVIVDRVIDANELLRNGTIYFFIANEGLSILENADGLGIKLYKPIRDALEQLKGDKDKAP